MVENQDPARSDGLPAQRSRRSAAGIPEPIAVATHYDEMDDVYRQVWSDHAHHGLWRSGRESVDEAVEALSTLAIQAADVEHGSQVIDLGSGYGATGRLLVRSRDARVTSFTISPRQYDYATAADADDPRLRHQLRDWLGNGLDPQSADAVIAIESINHLDVGPALAECHRVLKPGGRLVIMDLVAGDEVPDWQVTPLLRRMEEESHLRPLPTLAGLRSELTDAGFAVGAIQDLTRGVRRTWPRAIRRLLGRLPRDPAVRRVLFSDEYENQGFLLSILRMTAGYRLGAVRFCLVVARRR